MYKFMIALFLVFSSLSSIPAIAANCNGGAIRFNTDPSDRGYWKLTNVYTSAKDDPLLIMQVTVQNGMRCDPDYVENLTKKSKMVMRITSGGTCKNSTTITTPYPGIEWQLEGMYCDSTGITSNNIKSGQWDGKIDWPAGTVLGKAKLVVNEQYWMQNTKIGQYTVSIPSLSEGNTLSNSPAINVGSVLGGTVPFVFNDNSTCSMELSTENLDFGKLTPNDVNNDSLYKELSVRYSCKNRAMINGLYVRFEPENVVNAANGLFSASDSNGRRLNFQITRLYGNLHTVPLNANYQILEPRKPDLDATATFRINVKPSTPFPVGKVSTYLNVSLIYR
ncbi:fimbrial protein [Escherichia coli]|uniref:fimbrial protein n=1 Tax=Escherichia TaxID=561 RepID=UPI001D18773B|nr:fimbrial protein [Escherichia coli]MCC4038954.1 fimbrial protein [Escherichia coli]HAY5553507.1 fimbrial protein [Escherichia coli]HCN5542187.1 fimbrial protein [Escherichia coli]HCN5545120.1 fimbrial protein [Escherichia coli]